MISNNISNNNRIAIGVIGEYSPVFLRNNFPKQCDFFCFSFSEIPDNIRELCIVAEYCTEHPYTVIPDYSTCHSSITSFVIYEYSFNWCRQRIRQHETESGWLYSTIYLITFRHIVLDFPILPSSRIMYSHIAELAARGVPQNSLLDAVEIMTDSFVCLNGLPYCLIYDLPEKERVQFLTVYFDGKVMESTWYSNSSENDITFIIPSVVKTSDKKIHCTGYRTIMSPEERLRQTIKQVNSIKQMNATYNVETIICEGSILGLDALSELATVSNVVLFTTDQIGCMYANAHPNKSLYEVYVMKHMINRIKSLWYFKFGGRYYLAPTFSLDRYTKSAPVINKISGARTFTKEPICQAVIYSFPYSYVPDFDNMYREMIHIFETKSDTAIENELYKHLIGDSRVHWTPYLGVIGYDALLAKLHYI